MKILPPKRFEDPYDPIFDPIRHEGWFEKLLKRRAQVPMLEAARVVCWAAEGDYSQKAAAALYGVDPRELRDYTNWVNKTPRKAISAQEQAILDQAYHIYEQGWVTFGAAIRSVAPLFGVKGRPIEEMWEIRHDFWPSNYVRRGQ